MIIRGGRDGSPTNRRKWIYLPAAAILILIAAIGISQMLEPPRAPYEVFPQGAFLYLEAKDLKSLLSWWQDSELRLKWEQTPNYAQFTTSRLYLKLRDRVSKYGSGGKFQFNLKNLITSSGKRSALAVYNIGELKGIAATQISETEAFACELWMAKERFSKKTVNHAEYYVETGEGTLCFAYSRPYLLAATDEDLLRKALQALESSEGGMQKMEEWQLVSSKRSDNADVSLFLNMSALNESRYFRRYWIHRNVSQFKGIRSMWIDLKTENHELVEQRYFAREKEPPAAAGLPVEEYLQPFHQLPYESLMLDRTPPTSDIAEQILKFIHRFPQKLKQTSEPPSYTAAFARASSAEQKIPYLQRIDEVLPDASNERFIQFVPSTELSHVLETANPRSQLRLSYPVWDDQPLFVRFSNSLLIHLGKPDALSRTQFQDLLLKYYLLLYSTQDSGARWKQLDQDEFVLESLHPVYIRYQNPWVLMSNRESDFQAIKQVLTPPAGDPDASYSIVRWQNARWKFSRLMRRLDYRSFNDESIQFFSQNIDSLVSILPFAETSFEKKDSEETVRYGLQ